jgi:hypothetical protein
MAKATTTINFSDGDQVTSINLDQIIGGFSLGSDSADGSTITIDSGGVIILGIVGAANMGANSVATSAVQNGAITQEKHANASVGTDQLIDGSGTEAKHANGSVSWAKTKADDRATQSDMQSEAADHFLTPATMKYHPGVSKAGGVVTMTTGAIAGGYNISGSASGTATSRTITLGVTMANTNYRVQFSQEDSATTANAPSITGKTTTTFTINGGGTAYGFDVFGQLA